MTEGQEVRYSCTPDERATKRLVDQTMALSPGRGRWSKREQKGSMHMRDSNVGQNRTCLLVEGRVRVAGYSGERDAEETQRRRGGDAEETQRRRRGDTEWINNRQLRAQTSQYRQLDLCGREVENGNLSRRRTPIAVCTMGGTIHRRRRNM